MAALLYFTLGIMAPLVGGPLAGMVFIYILKHRKLWLQIPFWLGLLVFNLLITIWVLTSRGVWLPVASVSAFIFTPVAAIVTVPVMRHVKRRVESTGEASVLPKRWFRSGIVGIPVVQAGLFTGAILFAPVLCQVGLVMCPGG